jgi:glutaredoxin 3
MRVTSMAKVEIFTYIFCPYCIAAKRILKKHGILFEERNIVILFGWMVPTRNYKEMFERSGGKTTVPQIFINNRYYGDASKIQADDQADKLDAVFKS